MTNLCSPYDSQLINQYYVYLIGLVIDKKCLTTVSTINLMVEATGENCRHVERLKQTTSHYGESSRPLMSHST